MMSYRRAVEVAGFVYNTRRTRRRHTIDVLDALLTAQQRAMSVAIGIPPSPLPSKTCACRHDNWRHSDIPGLGCTVKACLCLETLTMRTAA